MVKKNIYLFVILFAALAGLYYYNKYRVAPKMDFFNLEVYDENNVKADLGSFHGKKLIVTYYASWCRDCLVEMKALNEIKDSKLSGVEVIAITDEPVEKLISFREKKNYPFHFFRFNKKFPDMKVNSIPVNYLVNTKGIVVWDKTGAPDWNNETFVKQALQMME